MHANARGAPELLLATAIESLRSGRHHAASIVFALLDGFQFALGGLFISVFSVWSYEERGLPAR